MDTLALLCTLHADGPTTWRRLRENGCHSLPELARFEAVELAEILGGTLAGARRFLREARHLGERSGANLLEREEAAATPIAAALPPAVTEEAETMLPVRDQQIVDDVLRSWREQDTRELAASLPAAPDPERVESEPEPELETEPEVVVTPFVAQHALQPDLIDGLSELVCERLHAEGVHSFEALLEADLGQLALHSGLGYSRLYRWRSLTERYLRAQTSRAPAAGGLRISLAELPAEAPPRDLLQIPARGVELSRRTLRWSPLEEGAAGPFA